ncbi:MAG: hypothetical protein B7X39_02150 [Lysobacterales bacterium 14-68-21]|jgi:tetratricopeptide (TPR) repeat protein|nr:MAG: hypothetical protein B7X45_03780 [Xanthomonadales bacterium 15-68-25]OZB67999.1 MAG: hypothetical protein B7X39_02150 [Xanthomonadales bacterium 14-68-21]
MRTARLTIAGLTIIATALWAYWPGLHGGFLFDDFANLPVLGAQGPITHWTTFWQYITSGQADPTGRPLSLLSFLIDAHDWPASPFPFKRTNLIIHLLNGSLLAVLLARLGQNHQPQDERHRWRATLAGGLAAALWMLHPLMVSTTLYVVQREAMLAATMTLTGLLMWLVGRRAVLVGDIRTGWLWMVAGLWGGTLAAFLCKANGLLLPALALTLDATVIAGNESSRQTGGEPIGTASARARLALRLLAGPPALFLALFLLHAGYMGIAHGISANRPWTLGERLLTEPRVLIDYLRLLWLPRPFTSGLFNDQFQASTSLWHPASTLPAMMAIGALIMTAALARRRWPIFAASVLFYFVGQSMESSTVALELYFEHRNYLPAMLMFWPLAWWILSTGTRPSPAAGTIQAPRRLDQHPAFRVAVGIVVIALLAVMTRDRAELWGNNREQALLWARLNPASPRAQAYAAMTEMSAGRPDAAIKRLTPVLEQHPREVQIALNLLSAHCEQGHIPADSLQAAELALRESLDAGGLLASWFGRVIAQSSHPICPELVSPTISALLDAAAANPRLAAEPGRMQDILSLKGQLALQDHRYAAALDLFDRALALQVRPTTAFQQAALLGSAGQPELGLQHLAYYESIKDKELRPGSGMRAVHAWVLREQGYWPRELVRLRHTLSVDAQARPQK